MTRNQYGTMRYIIGHEITVDYCRIINGTTLGSLLHNKWVKRRGDQVIVTNEGFEAFESYRLAQPAYRNHEADLSERVNLMLQFGPRRNGHGK